MSTPSLLILPGDGIGPEVMAEVRKIISWYGEKRDLNFDVSEDLVGGIAYDTHGTPLTDATMAKAQEVDAVLLGAVGGPKYDALDFNDKPERGLLRLRKEMEERNRCANYSRYCYCYYFYNFQYYYSYYWYYYY